MGSIARNPVRIAVTPIFQDGNGATVCEVDELAGSSAKVKGGVVQLKKNKDYQLIFEIQPPQNGCAAVSFPSTGSQAFLCSGSGCPNTGSGSSGGFLNNPQVDPTQQKLTVDADQSSNKSMMFYRLNFADGTNYDPIVIHD